MQIRPVVVELFPADEQTDMTMLIVANTYKVTARNKSNVN
jgi:hypothetical protein